uniref:Uncharacterized protein n=1 Tax=Anguilla anguilla TaxID=7936 RepID=A0A0E9PFS8_ANGAN
MPASTFYIWQKWLYFPSVKKTEKEGNLARWDGILIQSGFLFFLPSSPS